MDPLSLIVVALAAGAASGLKDTAPVAIKDAYAGIKRFIVDKYAAAHPDVERLEQDPNSEARRAVVKEELGKLGAARDPDLIAKAEVLSKAVEQHDPEAARTFGINLKGFEGGELQLGGVKVHSDTGPATGVDLQGGKVPGKTVIGDVEVKSGAVDPKAEPQ